DWFAYASFAIYFAKVFFPHGDQTEQLLPASVIFALGFLARPVGAWAMGLFADRAGRRIALATAVVTMAAGSLLAALAPGYAAIGAWAPALLTLARIVQGFSLGGQYGVSATYLSEMAGREHRGFWSSFQFVTLIGGQLIALAVLIVLQHALSPAQLTAWGWRLAFLIGAVLAVAVFAIQLRLDETRSYAAAKAEGAPRAKTMLLFTRHPRETAIVFALTSAGSLSFYAFTTYMQKFLTNTARFSKDQATDISAWSLVALLAVLPVSGWLGDRLGRKALLGASFALMAILTWPILSALARQTNEAAALALLFAILAMFSGYAAMSAVVKAELFPANVRGLGVALPYACANAVFGGTAEVVALSFKQAGLESGFFVYVSVVCAIAFIVAARMRDTQVHSQIVED
ncbi:MAG TPA: MFS transporter, partial [Caulobacteraceae bacterium]|nr:MFS transporter [Caulobacteraceae bacterium]